MTSCSRCNETVYEVSNPVAPDRIRELAITPGDDADHCSHPNPLAAGLADPDEFSRQGHDITGQPKMCRESSGSAQHGKCLTGEMPVSAGSVSVGTSDARRLAGAAQPRIYLSTLSAPARRRGIAPVVVQIATTDVRVSLIDLPGASAPGALFPHRAAVEGKFADDRSAWETGSRPIVPRSAVLRGFFRSDDVQD